MLELFKKALIQKSDLLQKICTQMQYDRDVGILRDLTVEKWQLARNNLDAAQLHLESGKVEQALHFYSRSCVNLGEFHVMSRYDRGLA